jgi:hypothetical protein
MGGTQERRWNFWYWLGLAFAAYLLPLIAFFLDAMFFGGKLFQWVGPELRSLIDNVYWPVIFLWLYFFGYDRRHRPARANSGGVEACR